MIFFLFIYIVNGMYVVVIIVEDFLCLNIFIGGIIYIFNDLMILVNFQVNCIVLVWV